MFVEPICEATHLIRQSSILFSYVVNIILDECDFQSGKRKRNLKWQGEEEVNECPNKKKVTYKANDETARRQEKENQDPVTPSVSLNPLLWQAVSQVGDTKRFL